MLTQREADNIATLIDLLENEVKDREYDQGSVDKWFGDGACCALGHADLSCELFSSTNNNQLDDKFGEKVEIDVFSQHSFGRVCKGRPARLEAIRRLKKILDDEGWEVVA